MSSKVKKQKSNHSEEFGVKTFPRWLLRTIVSIYIFIILGIYPLITRNKYADIGPYKFEIFRNVTVTLAIVAIIIFPAYLICEMKQITWKELKAKISLLDKFVLVYLLASVVSYVLSDYKSQAIAGLHGWNMGVIAQIAFVMIYFLVSRFFEWDIWVIGFGLLAACAVFFLGILHRFYIDPLGFYPGLSEFQMLEFLSTQGQATWYSSYVSSVFPLGIFFFWFCTKRWSRIVSGIFSVLAFGTLVTQNSDSAFIAIVLVMMVFLWFSLNDNLKWKHFLELVLLMLVTFRCMGILQIIFKEHTIQLDTLSVFASQSVYLWPVLLVVILLYVLTINLDNEKRLEIQNFLWVRKAMVIGAVLTVVGMITFIVLNTNGVFGKTYGGYLFYDRSWGNGRGFTWSYAVSMFGELPLVQKMFGVGPDCFSAYSYEFHTEYLQSMWGKSVLPNAHNEWMNSVLCYGIFGAVAYIGIFVSAIRRFCMNAGKKPVLVALSACILSYMGHNLFCYQQCICTPTIFIMIGIGEYIVRNKVDHSSKTYLGGNVEA